MHTGTLDSTTAFGIALRFFVCCRRSAHVLLFVLFARVQGPLWACRRMPMQAGWRTKWRPGSMSKLSLSDEWPSSVIQRHSPFAAEQISWRGPVLWNMTGKPDTRV